jgi:peroxiredoxin
MLVNFWATWCVPCAKEMPELEALYPRLRESGVDLLGVSVDTETADQVPGYLAKRRITYPVAVADPGSVSEVFPRGEILVPMSFLLDGQGRVLEVFSGWSERTEAALAALAGGARSTPAP